MLCNHHHERYRQQVPPLFELKEKKKQNCFVTSQDIFPEPSFKLLWLLEYIQLIMRSHDTQFFLCSRCNLPALAI